ncbi:hypothetical protein [Denitratimonas sp. CY0512]|uniref:hypothetical protein n=1 Tax=Denitratimonas sp. CY0512 TaxID=3131940 RepID=UPI0030AAAE58
MTSDGLADARSLDEFIRASSSISTGSHAVLRKVWHDHFEPTLRKASAESKPTPSAIPDAPKPRGNPKRKTSEPGPFGTSEGDNNFQIVSITRTPRGDTLPRPTSAPKLLPDEPADELTPPLTLAALSKRPRDPDALAVAIFQAQQATRSNNHLLCPEHPSALPLATYAQVIDACISICSDPNAAPDLRLGSTALLVQGLMGRTTATLPAVVTVHDADARHDPYRIEWLSAAAGAIRLSTYWQVPRPSTLPSYYRPTPEQAQHLEPVQADFTLQLIPPLRDALIAAEPELASFASTSSLDLDAAARLAASHIRVQTGLSFTPGRLRNSLAPHLVDFCGDVAVAQLLCADTLGLSTAPLAYYAPRKAALREIFWGYQTTLLGTNFPRPSLPTDDERIGSHLLASTGTARGMARAVPSILHQGIANLIARGRVSDVHTALVNQLAGMLVAVATHRPTEALFNLTIHDIWIDGNVGAALFADKIIDAAHDPRLVALPPTLCRQLEAYLEHLFGLGEQFPELRQHVQHTLEGTAPLLFAVTKDLQPATLDLGRWKQSLPAAWRDLPLNWGRHWVRTHAIEQGIHPALVSMQMGHLEAVGYPFSGSSPSDPWAFVDEVAHQWDRLAAMQGWRVVQGADCQEAWKARMLTPLRPWADTITQAEARQRTMSQQWREVMRSRLRAIRTEALAHVQTDPELVAAGIIDRYADKSRRTPHALTRADFERIRNRVYADSAVDTACAIARADAVCRIARVVNRRTGQQAETPGPIVEVRRPLDNAFIPGMGEAMRQIYALRGHFGTTKPATQGWRDLNSACSHVALAMIIFGRIESPSMVRGAIVRRGRLRRSARLQDLILVPFGDAPHEVIALRGVAAIAFARLAFRYKDQTTPEWSVVDQYLFNLLPSWAVAGHAPQGNKVLSALCETVSVTNRFELSPAARLSMREHGGSTSASQIEQLAYIDQDAPGTIDRSEEASEPETACNSASPPSDRRGNARTQYLRLCGILPSPERDAILPATQELISGANANTPAARAKVAAEINAQLQWSNPQNCLHPIVRALAGWTLDMFEHGTARRTRPAISTVRTYLTRIGGVLVSLLGKASTANLDETALEEAYLTVIESKPELQHVAAAALLSFHAYAVRWHGFPELDLSEIRLYLGKDADALADARLITPQERAEILKRLVTQAQTTHSRDPDSARLSRLAAYAMPLIAHGGLRRGEAFGIQLRDVAKEGGDLAIHVRPNRSRALKTLSARRVVRLSSSMAQPMNNDLFDWAQTERKRITGKRVESAFVFAPRQLPHGTDAWAELQTNCLEVCREVTGLRRPRLHHFRHLVAMQLVTPIFLHSFDQDTLGPETFPSLCTPISGSLALPRDLQRQVIKLGHASPSTTLKSYYHLPWLLASRIDRRDIDRYLNVPTLATLMGLSRHALYATSKRNPERAPALAWLDVQLAPRSPGTMTQSQHLAPEPAADDGPVLLRTNWTAESLGQLLTDVHHTGSLEQALLVAGGDPNDADAIRKGLAPIENRLGRRLLNEHRFVSDPSKPRRRLKRLKAGKSLEVLWDWYDKDSTGVRKILIDIAAACDRYGLRHHGDRLVIPGQTDALRSILLRAGISAAQIVDDVDDSGTNYVRLLRPNVEHADNLRYLGLELKRVLAVIRLASRIMIRTD